MNDADRLKQLEQFLQDAAAFLDFAYGQDRPAMIPPTLAHDISGLIANPPGFLPRVDGYAKRYADRTIPAPDSVLSPSRPVH